MNSPRRQTLAAWLTLLACTSGALLPIGGLSICLGADGHIGFSQPAAADACPCDALEVACVRLDEHQHPPCRDIEIEPARVFFQRTRATDQGDLGVPGLVAVSQPGPLAAADLWPPLGGANRAPLEGPPAGALDARRTIVLLI